MKVVDWKARAERLEALVVKLAGGNEHYLEIARGIMAITEREYADVHQAALYPLFEHMSFEYNLTLTDSQLNEIVRVVNAMQWATKPNTQAPQEAEVRKPQVSVDDMVAIAHKRIDVLFEMLKDHTARMDGLAEFKQAAETRFESLAEFADTIRKWAEKEQQSRGVH